MTTIKGGWFALVERTNEVVVGVVPHGGIKTFPPYLYASRVFGHETREEAEKDWRDNHCVGRLVDVVFRERRD